MLGGGDPWVPTNAGEVIQRLTSSMQSLQVTGSAINALTIYQCYNESPRPGSRAMIAVVLYAGGEEIMVATKGTIPSGGIFFELGPQEQQIVGTVLPVTMQSHPLPIWRQIPEGDVQRDSWVETFGQMIAAGGVEFKSLTVDTHVFKVLEEPGKVSDILVRHQDYLYHLDRQVFSQGGHFIRLTQHHADAFESYAGELWDVY